MTQTTTIPPLQPLMIGDIVINPPLFLAPMAGQTNRALRDLCRMKGGCGLVCTELLSSHAMQYKGSRKRTFQRFDWDGEELPFAVQLFGSDPTMMAEAAKIVVDSGAPIVDINMGCWVPKVARKGGGAALLKDIRIATAVVEAVVKAVDVPVTVKVRAGWEAGKPTAIDFARAAEEVGAQAITVHGRYAKQGFSGEPDWDIIRRVKEAVRSIPVIGNGDVRTADDVRRIIAQTGCDGVMIGRAALGNPWIFSDILYELEHGQPTPPHSWEERAEAMLWQAHRALETTRKPPIIAIRELRGQLIKYCHGMPDATTIREHIIRAETLEDIEAALHPILALTT